MSECVLNFFVCASVLPQFVGVGPGMVVVHGEMHGDFVTPVLRHHILHGVACRLLSCLPYDDGRQELGDSDLSRSA